MKKLLKKICKIPRGTALLTPVEYNLVKEIAKLTKRIEYLETQVNNDKQEPF